MGRNPNKGFFCKVPHSLINLGQILTICVFFSNIHKLYPCLKGCNHIMSSSLSVYDVQWFLSP